MELKFRVGDIIYVYGDMDEDGFFMVREIILFWESKILGENVLWWVVVIWDFEYCCLWIE